MKRGFSYLEVLISLFIIGVIIISSSSLIIAILKISRYSTIYKKEFYILNNLWEKGEVVKELKKYFTLKVENHEDSIFYKLKDKTSGRVFYIYKSKIINL